MSKNKIFLPCHSSVKWSNPGDFLKAQFVIFRCQKYVKKRVHGNEKMNLPCAFKKCPGLLHFTTHSKVLGCKWMALAMTQHEKAMGKSKNIGEMHSL